MIRSEIRPLAVVPRYFDIAASLRPRTDGGTGFLGEVDDAASPLAGMSAVGSDLASTAHELGRAAWAVLHEPVIREAADVDPDTLAGVRIHLTVLHELAATDLGGSTNTGAGRPAGDPARPVPTELPPGRGGLSLVSAGTHTGRGTSFSPRSQTERNLP
jgi:hypothetical protein